MKLFTNRFLISRETLPDVLTHFLFEKFLVGLSDSKFICQRCFCHLTVSYTHLDVYKRQVGARSYFLPDSSDDNWLNGLNGSQTVWGRERQSFADRPAKGFSQLIFS